MGDAVNGRSEDGKPPAPRPEFLPPRQMPGTRKDLPPGTLPPPHFDRQGDEQRQPSREDLDVTGRVQRDLVPKPG
jgi:hypothetical protein